MSAIIARARADRPVLRRDLVRAQRTLQATARSAIGARGQDVLGRADTRLTRLLQIYDSDPTLAGCPAGREASFEAIPVAVAYLLDQVGVASGASPRRHQQQVDPEEAWALAEATVERLQELTVPALAVARINHDTMRGQHLISRIWTEAVADELAVLAGRINELLAPALELEHVDPATRAIRALADSLALHTGKLVRTRTERVSAWDKTITNEADRARARYERARGALAETGGNT